RGARRMAPALPLRRGTPSSAPPPVRAPLVPRRRGAGLDDPDRPGGSRAAPHRRSDRARGAPALGRPAAGVRLRVLVPPLLRRVRRPADATARAFAPRGPEARRGGDDGRAGGDARHRARAPRSRGAPRTDDGDDGAGAGLSPDAVPLVV